MKNLLNFPKTSTFEKSDERTPAVNAPDIISKAEWSRHVRLKLELAATTKSWNEAALTLARQAAAMLEMEEKLAIEEKRLMERIAAGAQIEDGGRVDALPKAGKKAVRPAVM